MKVLMSVAEQHTERAVIRIRNQNVEVAVMIDISDSDRCGPLPTFNTSSLDTSGPGRERSRKFDEDHKEANVPDAIRTKKPTEIFTRITFWAT